jgi:hypothetical protein
VTETPAGPHSRDNQLLAGRRKGMLSKASGGSKVGRRTIVLDANVLLDKKLSVFL